MKRILVVDDELLVRVGIKSMIAWEEHGFEMVGDAGDGREALRMIEQEVPDIVLTDIVMPEMDGLALIKRAKQKYPFMRFIVLSSHNDYHFVREAMKYGADDYVLKASVRPEELLPILEEVACDINQTNKNLHMHQEENVKLDSTKAAAKTLSFLSLLCEPEGAMDAGKLVRYKQELQWDEQPKHSVLLFIKLHFRSQISFQDRKRVANSFVHLMGQKVIGLLDEGVSREIFTYKENEFVLQLLYQHKVKEDHLRELAQDIIIATQRFLNATVSIGIGGWFGSLENMKRSFIQAREAVQYSYYEGTGQPFFYEKNYLSSAEAVLLTAEDKKNIRDGVDIHHEKKIKEVIDPLFDRMARSRVDIQQVIEQMLEMYHVIKNEALHHEIKWEDVLGNEHPIYQQLQAIETLADMKSWFYQFVEQLCRVLQMNRKEHYREEVQKLIDYMRVDYHENISLQKAAEYVNMSESYLSLTFRKETGKNFVEYLTGIRMHKAAEYLKNTTEPSYLIAEKVGYENVNYFGRAFKKVFGFSPSQYRNRFAGQAHNKNESSS